MRFTLLMPAAGSGERLGLRLPKALIPLAGRPMFVWSVLPFFESGLCDQMVIAVPSASRSEFTAAAGIFLREYPVHLVEGGATRQDSVARALDAVSSDSELVVVHDAARPLVSLELVHRVVGLMPAETAAVVPGLPVTDTIKLVNAGTSRVLSTLDRRTLISVQTPQALRRGILAEAHRQAIQQQYQATDDVALVEHFELGSVEWVDGDPANIKITYPQDVEVARKTLEARATAGRLAG